MHAQLQQLRLTKASLQLQQNTTQNSAERNTSLTKVFTTNAFTIQRALLIRRLKFSSVHIKDWPEQKALADDLLVKVVSEIHDPVTTTDELIPSGETSSFRSNPLGLAEFTLSRKDPAYVGRAKAVRDLTDEVKAEIKAAVEALTKKDAELGKKAANAGTGSTIFAVKPGDGSAREQAASCQRVLGASANIANEYATKRYRSNLINWGMLPFIYKEGDKNLPFANGDYVFIPGVKKMIAEKLPSVKAYAVRKDGSVSEFELSVGDLTDDERKIILAGCLINFYRD